MSSSIPNLIAETVQTAHIKRDPSPRHDLNPSTAASRKEPIYLSSSPNKTSLSDLDGEEEEEEEEEEDIPLSVLTTPHPRARRQSFPPMPDLRFEQSYLNSIANAQTWWHVTWITIRDQIMMPLAQGVLYNLAVVGWQHWNRNAQISGNTAGARIRRWWYGVNNWPLPANASAKMKTKPKAW